MKLQSTTVSSWLPLAHKVFRDNADATASTDCSRPRLLQEANSACLIYVDLAVRSCPAANAWAFVLNPILKVVLGLGGYATGKMQSSLIGLGLLGNTSIGVA